MNLRQRLLFLLIPLTILPLVFITVTALFLVRQIPYPVLTQPYATLSLIFIGIVSSATIAILVSVANSISRPLNALKENTRKIADGNWEASLPEETGTSEVDQLALSIEKMKTELRRQQEHIRQTAADAAVGQIASHVAHDLASPLSSMQTALEYFRELKTVDGKTPEYLNLLELSSKRLKSISKDLLDRRGGREPKKILFSLHKLLDELIGEYQTQPQYNCVEFAKQYHPESLFIFGDRAKMQRAFGNLIKNAIEAMDKCGALTVATRRSQENAVVEIQDNGSGMTPEILEKVLQGGFSQGKEEGHGIGTMVVQQTLAEHGGALTAHSEIGIGTTFCAELPFPVSQQVKEADREEEIVEVFEIVSKKGEPIIVIDDDAAFLEQWRMTLDRERKAVLLCTSFEDFLEQGFTTRLSKTAIVDYHFENSELNGMDVIRRLKEMGFVNLYLCTVEYWKPLLKKQAEELGVKICPKPLPKIVLNCHSEPLRIRSGQAPARNPHVTQGPRSDKSGGYTVLVIDDDETIRLAWELMDRKLQIQKLHTFANLEAMMETAGSGAGAGIDLAAVDIAFVDKNILGSHFTGAQVVAYLKARGVPKVILASGEDSGPLRQNPEFSQADFIVSEKIPQSFKEFFS